MRLLAWLGGIFIAAMAGEAAYGIWQSYSEAVQVIERDTSSQARLIAEQTARGIQSVDLVLGHVAQDLARGRLSTANPLELRTYLHEQSKGLGQVDGLVVVGPGGGAAGEGAGLRIMGVELNPTSGQHTFSIERDVIGADGKPAAIVRGHGRVDYFQSFYKTLFVDPSTRVALMLRDGRLIARHPPAGEMLGQRLGVIDTVLPPGVSSAIARLPSPVDGKDHLVALQVVADYPLAVAVSRDAAAALAPWRKSAAQTGARMVMLGAFAGVLLWAALRQLRRAQLARHSLEISDERYTLAMTGSDEGHWLWDIVQHEVYVSSKLAALMGIAGGAQTLRDEDYFAAIPLHAEDREWVHRARNDHVNGLTQRLDHEFRIVAPATGDVRWIHTRAQCFRDAAGQPVRMAGSSVDITLRKRAEHERDRLQRQLIQAQKLEAIGTLAGGIAHDFNNILAAILGYGELAQKASAPGSAQRRHIDAAIAAALRAKSLVERILAFSRSGIAERVPVHVGSAVADALDGVAASLPREVTLTRRLEAGDAGILGDVTQIHQVVLNLCTNAAHALRGAGDIDVVLDRVRLAEPTTVTTCTLASGDYLRLGVCDSGDGIAVDVAGRIFDPFYTTRGVGVGTGLGLSLVHGIVTDLGGGILVDSEPGRGTRMEIFLPVTATQVAVEDTGDIRVERGQGETILVVDDEEGLVRLAEESLAELGYEPVGYSSARAALDAVAADPERFDLVLSDEAMPGLTGTELALAVRGIRPDLPFILMSGFVTPAVRAGAQDAGVATVLGKPLMASEIAKSLAAALRDLRTEAD